MKVFAGFLVAIVIIASIVSKFYNQFPTLEEGVKEKWSLVQNQYKRRADLIPNLVKTVQGYATHEKSVFSEVTEARSKVSQININAGDINDPAKMREFIQAQQGLSGALSRLIAVSENYPQLKADENFKMLQTQLEGTENRIAVARKDYISEVKKFNVALRTFPGNIVASVFFSHLKPLDTFETSPEDQKAPVVSF